MAQNVNPTFVKTPNMSLTQFSTGVGISGQNVTCYSGGVNGSKIVGIWLTANTSVTQDVRLNIAGPSAGPGQLVTVSVTQSAGFVGTSPPINGFLNAVLPKDSDGNQFFFLPSSGWILEAQVTTLSSQWASGNTLNVFVTAGDF